MEELYSEDLRLGQLTAVQEIVGAMAFDPVLGDEIGRRMQPWVTFAEQLAARIIAGSPLAGFVDPSVIGSAGIALYMGLEIVARMRGGDSSGSSALMTTLVQAAPWVDQLLGKATPRRRRPTTRVAVEGRGGPSRLPCRGPPPVRQSTSRWSSTPTSMSPCMACPSRR